MGTGGERERIGGDDDCGLRGQRALPSRLQNVPTLLNRNIAIIARARRSGASDDGTTGEFRGYGFVDAGFVN